MTVEQVAGIIEYATETMRAYTESADYVASVEVGTMADGSTRTYAIVHTIDVPGASGEEEFRFTSPCDVLAPAWAGAFTYWKTELRNGDRWDELDRQYDGPVSA